MKRSKNLHEMVFRGAYALFCFALVLDGRTSLAQSFDCAKAGTAVEKAICGRDSELRSVDEEMGEAYKVLLDATPADEKSALRQAQRQWIERRDKECPTASEQCLEDVIRRREEELEKQLARQLRLSPVAYQWIRAYAYLSVRDVPRHAVDVKDHFGRCRQLPPSMSREFAALVPNGYESLFGIATHRCDAVLRVYLSCPSPSGADSSIDFMDGCSEFLILEDTEHKHAQALGELHPESRTGNSGGIFVPIAFTKDDRHIVLRAWMGDPGAGGGQVDYGYDVMAREAQTDERAPLAAAGTGFRDHFDKDFYSGTLFYDDYGKVVYTVDSDKVPAFSLPGPRTNSGRLVVKDLATLSERTVLEEADTTFEIVKVDEEKRTLTIRAIRHSFSAECPRDEDALYCSQKTVRERQIPLP